MNKKSNIIYSILVFLFAFSFNFGVVNAYFTDKTETKANTFTIAESKEVTYEYYYLDENDTEIEVQSSNSNTVFAGTQININDTLTNLDCSSIKHYANGNLYNGNTYVVNDTTTIKEVCELNRYTITYNLDGGTLSNPKTTYTSMTETFDLPIPTKTGITFNGWTGSNGTTPQTNVTITKGSTGNKTYNANWQTTYNVTHNNGNFTFNGSNTAEGGKTYTATATLSGARYFSGVTVTMNGKTLTEGNDGYTYSTSGSTATINIYNVDGDINIQISTTNLCLPEGTLIMLWDGSYKKIEDITYNDLLRVWNHDTGTYGYEYAAWIEQAGTAEVYTKVTFSDGSELKVVGDHSIFSKTHNKYVNINSDEFKVGDEVVNLKDGIKYITVTSIEEVEEEVKYYHVITNRYFNMITNDILTTYEIYNNVSNYHGFGENLKWVNYPPSESLLSYEDMISQFGYVDKYLFKAFKMEDINYGLTNGVISVDDLNDLFSNYLMNNDRKVEPDKDDTGIRLWMVTTSDDNNPSKKSHQLEEGSTYKVPEPENQEGFKYWYNHSDNKYYNPGDLIEVDSSMYLEAIYE